MATSTKTPTETCPECSGRLTNDETEVACQSCGLVVDDAPIDHSHAWNAYNARERREKSHNETSNRDHHDRGLGSEIGVSAQNTSPKTSRLKRWNKQAKNNTEKDKSRGYATGEIHRISGRLELPQHVTKQAKALFRELHGEDLVAGRDLDVLAATCTYTASRVNQCGLTPHEFEAVARDVDARTLARRHTDISQELGVPTPPPCPEQRIRVVARETGVDDSVRDSALTRLRGLDDYERSRGSPSVIAATLLYDESDLTQSELSEVAGVSPPSIRSRLKEV